MERWYLWVALTCYVFYGAVHISIQADGGWSAWGNWTEICVCGSNIRTRTCDSPAPGVNDAYCSGVDTDVQVCDWENCTKEDGAWSDWDTWSNCSLSCGIGVQTRSRSCNTPMPQNGGLDCDGFNIEKQLCNKERCPSASYEATSTCSSSNQTACDSIQNSYCPDPNAPTGTPVKCLCSEGYVTRQSLNCTQVLGISCNTTTDCFNSAYQHSYVCDGALEKCTCAEGYYANSSVCDAVIGSSCVADSECQDRSQDDTMMCTDSKCECSRTLGFIGYPGETCLPESVYSQLQHNSETYLNGTGGWISWSTWSACSLTCGNGGQTRTRSCASPATCSGPDTEWRQCNQLACPTFGEWGNWGSCSLTCGTGIRSRSRPCNAVNNGDRCEGNLDVSELCEDIECPVDGIWSDWTTWSPCVGECDTGQQIAYRSCSNPAPQFNGTECSGPVNNTQGCALATACPTQGGWGFWSSWTACTASCEGGLRNRTRACDQPPPGGDAPPCEGDDTELELCGEGPCPAAGVWTEWQDWGTCYLSGVTCGSQAYERRQRVCANPLNGAPCDGDANEERQCTLPNCPIDGIWSSWSDWYDCTEACGGGLQTRNRTCNNPAPANGGINCEGNDEQTQLCNTIACTVAGSWTEWIPWSACSSSLLETCGSAGSRQRNRTCANPLNGPTCSGRTLETEPCNLGVCPTPGGWSDYGSWQECSKQCGGGIQSRNRTCTVPAPANGGEDCVGNNEEKQLCNPSECSVDGIWADWLDWSGCVGQCGTGAKTRTRTCSNPSPKNGGNECSASNIETESDTCQLVRCGQDGGFTDWRPWGDCSNSCGGGVQSRTRSCTNPEPGFGGRECTGNIEEYQLCSDQPCPVDGQWSEYDSWQDCVGTCGSGSRKRFRSCSNPSPHYNGQNCGGSSEETETCTLPLCPVDGGWGDWGFSSECSATCQGGYENRTRICNTPEPANGGAFCQGDSSEWNLCNTFPCPIAGNWGDWMEWSLCMTDQNVTRCGEGNYTRTRVCSNPSPAFAGDDCVGNATETMPCTLDPCPVNGKWAEWGFWFECSTSCGPGLQTRRRLCSNPAPAYGGSFCEDDSVDVKSCRKKTCAENPCSESPCKNGGSCMVTNEVEFTCQCFGGWEGQFCETEVITHTGTIVIEKIGGQNVTFGTYYNNRESIEFQTLEANLCNKMNEIMENKTLPLYKCKIKSVTQGSLKVEFDLYFPSNAAENVSIASVNDALTGGINNVSGGFVLGDFTVSSAQGFISDLNECTEKIDDCSVHAKCTNTEGSFTCKCLDGFIENSTDSRKPGRICTEPCGENSCHGRGKCNQQTGDLVQCKCDSRWTGRTCDIAPALLLEVWEIVVVTLSIAFGLVLIVFIILLVLWCQRKINPKKEEERAITSRGEVSNTANPVYEKGEDYSIPRPRVWLDTGASSREY